jgi:hypothetical protein
MAKNYISLNKISLEYLPDVEDCFKGTGLEIDTEHSVKTFSDTTFLDIMIFL